MSLPEVTRKTDKGLPRYEDEVESDVFILSGAEDLTPALTRAGGAWVRDATPSRVVYGREYAIHRYRPRVDSLFARIERWVRLDDPADTCWRSITRDNVTTWYGKTEKSRITDPADPAHVFSWLICESYDDKGNFVSYEYKAEDSTGVDFAQACERNRTAATRSANQYLKYVRYGNRKPYLPDLTKEEADAPPADFCFEVVFDYGDHDLLNPVPQDTGIPWRTRPDPFSSYRATFEVRTYRLCRRVLMFHHFPAAVPEVGNDCLVRSTDLTHAAPSAAADPSQPFYSRLASVEQRAYRRDGNGGYLTDSLPPLEFEYTEATVDETVVDAVADSLRNLPEGLDGSRYRWVDLDGEGLSGVLTEQAGSWFYKANLSPVNEQTVAGKPRVMPRFAPVETVGKRPSTAALNAGRQQLFSVSGDGQLDLVDYSGPAPGYYERTEGDGWLPFTPFESLPVLDWRDPQLKFIDLTGDGFPDLLLTDGDLFRWHESLGAGGFHGERRVPAARDDESGPRLVFADGTESIFTADMSGDGLTDLVRIRHGEVCYWPNLGYGRFGAKVTMDGAPLFDRPDLFDGRRVQLADIDGSGTADIVYFASGIVRLYFNQSGNAWGAARSLRHFPAVENASRAAVLDLLGRGTACLVWSSPLPGNARQQLRYIDLMGGQKPHLLTAVTNNLGAKSVMRYAPSTKFYVRDKLAGTPWVTRLPFPVHVVERVDTYDYISRNVFATRYAYHHGYYDGVEREFRGFGRVDQWDTEQFATLAAAPGMPDPVNLDEASAVPPVLTKTWFHTGAYFGEAAVSARMSGEYYPGIGRAAGIDDSILPADVLLADGTRVSYTFSPEELREASRSLRGSVLRQEVYGLDRSPAAPRPYSVSERNYVIEALQPQGPNRYGAFFAHPRETVDCHYERSLYWVAGGTIVDAGTAGAAQAADPRVTHELTLSVDGYGNVLEGASVGYGRQYRDPALSAADQATQSTTLCSYVVNKYTNAVESADAHRTPLHAQTWTYELVQVQPGAGARFPVAAMYSTVAGLADGSHDTPYENIDHAGLRPGQAYRRLVGQARTYYRPDDLGALAGDPRALLPLFTVQPMALPGATYHLAFTPGLIPAVYQRSGTGLMPAPANVLVSTLADGGGYVQLDGAWWVPGGRLYYLPGAPSVPQELQEAREHFYVPRRLEDPFGNFSTVSYDGDDLLVQQTTDAVLNVVSAVNDYRVLAPVQVTDANGNQAAIAYNVLGLVTATAVMGKPGEPVGDRLSGFVADLPPGAVDGLYNAADPHSLAGPLLGDATTRVIYDIHGFANSVALAPDDPTAWRPPFAATIVRERHVMALSGGEVSPLQIGFGYCDGLGRVIQKKGQAEPGPVVDNGPTVIPRWVGSGWTIFNNKWKPVRQYEPFFSQLAPGHQFEFGTEVGVSPVLCYDPPGRVVATVHPNRTYEKAVFDPWQLHSWDADDTLTTGTRADPAADPDVGAYIGRLPPADYLPTWYTSYNGGTPLQQQAAGKAAANAGTPTVTYLDALGRTFLTVTDNGAAGKYSTWVTLDIQGNQRAVTDALGRVVARYEYTMTRQRISQASMEAGQRWTLPDVAGKPVRAWDSRGHDRRSSYDGLRRVTGRYVRGTDQANSDPRTLGGEVQYEKIEYGESLGNNAQNLNVRTRIFRHYDAAGVVLSVVTDPVTGQQVGYDFKGNPLRGSRQFVQDEASLPDWSVAPPAFLPDVYVTRTEYDALNRVTAATAPDGSVTRPVYNEASLLTAVTVNLRGAAAATPFVASIDYNAKRQRTQITYGTGVAATAYEYDLETFWLTSLTTTRPGLAPAAQTVQGLSYTYDAVGNITHIQDDADIQNVVFFRNRRVEPSADFTYDAIYRLVGASGREQLGLNGGGRPLPPTPTSYNDVPRVGLLGRGDGFAMGTYTETYAYDAAGNFVTLTHRGTDPANPGWSRSYSYNEPSLLDPGQVSNRLSSTAVTGGQPFNEPYNYDPHGNMTAMPQLQQMRWDFADQLVMTSRRPVNNSDTDGRINQGERTYYVYNSAGERVRKTTISVAGTKVRETLYLGGYEVYRQYGSLPLERQTLHVMDDKQRVALVETTFNGNAAPGVAPQTAIRYQFGNHLDTASLELDENAAVISYEEYYPYGGTTYQAGRTTTEASQKRYRYTGKERDKETGLYYYGARYYAPWLGRWTACDPKARVNRYVYARNSPIVLFDPDGRDEDVGWNKAMGFLRVVGGTAQVLGGLFLIPQVEVPTIAQVAGAVAITHGLDDIKAGIKQFRSGRPEETDSQKAVTAVAKKLGASDDAAEVIGVVGDTALGFVTPTGIATGGPRAALQLVTAGWSKAAVATGGLARASAIAKTAEEVQAGTHLMMAAGGVNSNKPSKDTAGEPGQAGEPKSPPPKGTPAKLRPYEKPGGGHHIPSKIAFEGDETHIGDPKYDRNTALAIPNEELKRLGIKHGTITGWQQRLYSKFARETHGAKLTWEDMERIETEALVQSHMPRDMAQATVRKAIEFLKESGVKGAVMTPWGGK